MTKSGGQFASASPSLQILLGIGRCPGSSVREVTAVLLLFVGGRIADIMDITSEDLVNKNLYEFCHAEDLQKLHKAHVDCE